MERLNKQVVIVPSKSAITRVILPTSAGIGGMGVLFLLLSQISGGGKTSQTAVPKPIPLRPAIRDDTLIRYQSPLLSPRRVRAINERFRLRWPATTNELEHALRLWHTAGEIGEAECIPIPRLQAPLTNTLMQCILLDNDVFKIYYPNSEPYLRHSPYGVHVSENFELNPRIQCEAHPDHLLSVLAECQIPLDYKIRTPDGEATVQALLDDSLRTFLVGRQMEWSAVAYACYLAPQRQWKNRYGKSVSFDDLVSTLVGLPPGEGPCYGTHVCYALAAVLNVHREVAILSPAVANKAEERLREFGRMLTRSQYSDGAWREDWSLNRPPPGDLGQNESHDHRNAVLVTGHHLEWLILSPEGCVPAPSLQRALQFLFDVLNHDSSDVIRHFYNPYSHAARSLLLWYPQSEHRHGLLRGFSD